MLKITENPELQVMSSDFNPDQSRFFIPTKNCLAYVGCTPPLECFGHPKDLVVGKEATTWNPQADSVKAVDDLLNGLSENNQDIRTYLEYQLAECLITVDLTKKVILLTSNGNTGKTKLLGLLQNMSGPQGRILPGNRELFLGRRKARIKDVKPIRHKGGLLCEELGSEKSPINSDVPYSSYQTAPP